MPAIIINATSIMMTVIFSPKIKWENIAMKNMHAPVNIGYAMLKSIFLSAFVKNNTLMPPIIKPYTKTMNHRKSDCLFEILLYKR